MNLGFPEMLFIFLVALIIFGPKKLPEIGRHIGKALAEFKRASNEFKSQLETEMRQLEIDEALRKEKDSIVRALEAPAGTVDAAPGSEHKVEASPEAAAAAPDLANAAPEAAAQGTAEEDPYEYQHPYPPVEQPKSEGVKGTDA